MTASCVGRVGRRPLFAAPGAMCPNLCACLERAFGAGGGCRLQEHRMPHRRRPGGAFRAQRRSGQPRACVAFEDAVDRLQDMLGRKPEAVVRDMHPDFHASRYAEIYAAERGIPCLTVQHHKPMWPRWLPNTASPGPCWAWPWTAWAWARTGRPGAVNCCCRMVLIFSGLGISVLWRWRAAIGPRGSPGAWALRFCMPWDATMKLFRDFPNIRRGGGGNVALRCENAAHQQRRAAVRRRGGLAGRARVRELRGPGGDGVGSSGGPLGSGTCAIRLVSNCRRQRLGSAGVDGCAGAGE